MGALKKRSIGRRPIPFQTTLSWTGPDKKSGYRWPVILSGWLGLPNVFLPQLAGAQNAP
jgi:hypothetical protein